MTADLGLVRVQRETVQERIYGALRAKLMSGGFEPGQGLKLAELAKAFGTSATPVREALNRLIAERALEDLPNRTVRVPTLTSDQLRDLKEARCAIEGIAVTRAAQRMTPDAIDALARTIQAEDGHDAKNAPAESAEQNQLFHFTIYRQAGSAVLLAIIENLWLQSGPYLRLASEQIDRRSIAGTKYHSVILDALRIADGIAARRGLEADIERSFALAMDGTHDPAEGRRGHG